MIAIAMMLNIRYKGNVKNFFMTKESAHQKYRIMTNIEEKVFP